MPSSRNGERQSHLMFGRCWALNLVRQDNDIFQLSRNINVGFFATVVLKDYVAAILNTP